MGFFDKIKRELKENSLEKQIETEKKWAEHDKKVREQTEQLEKMKEVQLKRLQAEESLANTNEKIKALERKRFQRKIQPLKNFFNGIGNLGDKLEKAGREPKRKKAKKRQRDEDFMEGLV